LILKGIDDHEQMLRDIIADTSRPTVLLYPSETSLTTQQFIASLNGSSSSSPTGDDTKTIPSSTIISPTPSISSTTSTSSTTIEPSLSGDPFAGLTPEQRRKKLRNARNRIKDAKRAAEAAAAAAANGAATTIDLSETNDNDDSDTETKQQSMTRDSPSTISDGSKPSKTKSKKGKDYAAVPYGRAVHDDKRNRIRHEQSSLTQMTLAQRLSAAGIAARQQLNNPSTSVSIPHGNVATVSSSAASVSPTPSSPLPVASSTPSSAVVTPPTIGAPPLNIVVIDGTWSQARTLRKLLPDHVTCLRINADGHSLFAPLRKQSQADRCSTLEAAVTLLQELGVDRTSTNGLLDMLRVLVDCLSMQNGWPSFYKMVTKEMMMSLTSTQQLRLPRVPQGQRFAQQSRSKHQLMKKQTTTTTSLEDGAAAAAISSHVD
jgi:hypothetical protein